MSTPALSPSETADLVAARGYEERAFERLIAPHRQRLHAHCYRMLGSPQDAEDALQDALLRAWRGLPSFDGRSSLKTWLYRIATNACLRAIERRQAPRILPFTRGAASDPHAALGERLPELTWLGPYPDEAIADGVASPAARYEERETVELAFVAALQHLPGRQRAVLLLRDVLGFSPAEIAGTLDATPAAVSSALQRARQSIEDRLPDRSQQQTLRQLGDPEARRIGELFLKAWEHNDVDSLVTLLTGDALFAMPPRPEWYYGSDAISLFLRRFPLSPGHTWHLLPARASGQLAFGVYGAPTDPGGQPLEHTPGAELCGRSILLLTITPTAQIAEINSFHSVDFAEFGLPAQQTVH